MALAFFRRAQTSPEHFLWLILTILALYGQPTKGSLVLTLVNVLSRNDNHDEKLPGTAWSWRCCHDHRAGDAQGLCMSLVLLPIFLQYMSCDDYALRLASSMVAKDFNVITICIVGVFQYKTVPSMLQTVLFFATWLVLWNAVQWTSCLRGVFTKGEWRLVSSAAAIAICECVCLCVSTSTLSGSLLHLRVALVGWVGCLLGCIVAEGLDHWAHQRVLRPTQLQLTSPTVDSLCLNFAHFLVPKMLILVSVPLLTVEFAMTYMTLHTAHDNNTHSTTSYTTFPRSIVWLADFLVHCEIAVTTGLPIWRRQTWLAYWFACLCVGLPLAPNGTSRSATIARKWFHLVAMILFWPVTLAAPNLQSLAYAVAVCALLVLECVRNDVPWLNAFYQRYVDTLKDPQQTQQKQTNPWIISHMTLVLGCAVPLWTAEILGLQHGRFAVMALWGVLCLGVGDAMGAVVGKNFGTIEWGQNKRTVEGSAAMLVSLLICYYILSRWVEGASIGEVIPAIVFVTLLEAWTHQIDNLVLPIAGVTVMLICASFRPQGEITSV
jgi:dolichol kinase